MYITTPSKPKAKADKPKEPTSKDVEVAPETVEHDYVEGLTDSEIESLMPDSDTIAKEYNTYQFDVQLQSNFIPQTSQRGRSYWRAHARIVSDNKEIDRQPIFLCSNTDRSNSYNRYDVLTIQTNFNPLTKDKTQLAKGQWSYVWQWKRIVFVSRGKENVVKL